MMGIMQDFVENIGNNNRGTLEIDGRLFFKAEQHAKNALTEINIPILKKIYYLSGKNTPLFQYASSITEIFNNIETQKTNIEEYIEKIGNTRDKLLKVHYEFGADYYREAANLYNENSYLNNDQIKYDQFTEEQADLYLYKYLAELDEKGELPKELILTYRELKFKFTHEPILTFEEAKKKINNLSDIENINEVIKILNNCEKLDTLESVLKYNGIKYNFKYGKCVSIEIDGIEYPITYTISDNPRISLNTTNLFDQSNKKNDTYGGDQMRYAENYDYYMNDWKMNDLIEQFYPDITEEEKHDLLQRMTKTGCGYIAIANAVYSFYEGKEDDFKDTFGYDMYYIDTSGAIQNHTDYLAAELFLQTWDNKYTASFLSKDIENANNGKGLKISTGSSDDTYKGMIKYLEKTYNVKMDVIFKPIKQLPGESLEETLAGQISDALSYGDTVSVIINNEGYDYYTRDGTIDGKLYIKNGGCHAMTATRVTEADNIIVSSWGKEFIFKNPEENCNMIILSEPKK